MGPGGRVFRIVAATALAAALLAVAAPTRADVGVDAGAASVVIVTGAENDCFPAPEACFVEYDGGSVGGSSFATSGGYGVVVRAQSPHPELEGAGAHVGESPVNDKAFSTDAVLEDTFSERACVPDGLGCIIAGLYNAGHYYVLPVYLEHSPDVRLRTGVHGVDVALVP